MSQPTLYIIRPEGSSKIPLPSQTPFIKGEATPVVSVAPMKRPAEEDEEEMFDEDYGPSSATPSKRRRENLDHLTPAEKLARRKMKNRIAAQTARDRKKCKMDNLEQEFIELKDKYTELEAKYSRLQSQNELLMQLLKQQLDQHEYKSTPTSSTVAPKTTPIPSSSSSTSGATLESAELINVLRQRGQVAKEDRAAAPGVSEASAGRRVQRVLSTMLVLALASKTSSPQHAKQLLSKARETRSQMRSQQASSPVCVKTESQDLERSGMLLCSSSSIPSRNKKPLPPLKPLSCIQEAERDPLDLSYSSVPAPPPLS